MLTRQSNLKTPYMSLVLQIFLAKHHHELHGISYAPGLFWDFSKQNLIEVHQGQWVSIGLNQMRIYFFLYVQLQKDNYRESVNKQRTFIIGKNLKRRFLGMFWENFLFFICPPPPSPAPGYSLFICRAQALSSNTYFVLHLFIILCIYCN